MIVVRIMKHIRKYEKCAEQFSIFTFASPHLIEHVERIRFSADSRLEYVISYEGLKFRKISNDRWVKVTGLCRFMCT